MAWTVGSCCATCVCVCGRLVTSDGDLLGTTADVTRMQQEHIVAAIMSTVFDEYEHAGVECLAQQQLKFLLFNFEVGLPAEHVVSTRSPDCCV